MNKINKDLVSEEIWETTALRYVGFIDIMGFKDMVARSSHDEIYKMMQKINSAQKTASSINWNGNNKSNKLVKTTTYSDSIVIYSFSDSYDSLYSFICTIAGIYQDLLMEGIPHKGAIAFGKMTIDNERSIFFGQPLIDSYLLQEEVNFYGIIVHGTAQKGIETYRTLPFVDNYLCPLKNGNSFHISIRPIFWGIDQFKEDNVKLSSSLKSMRYNTSGHIRKYIDLTEEFLQSIIKTPNAEY